MATNNQNRLGSLEYAVRHAMEILGAEAVAKALGCSTSQIYKATQPNPTRSLPDPKWSQICELVTMLKNASRRSKDKVAPDRSEHFTDVLRMLGKTQTVPSLDVHRCMTHATADSGAFARLVLDVTNKPRQSETSLTKADLARVSASGRQAMASIAKVIAVCDYHAKPDAHDEVVVLELEDM